MESPNYPEQKKGSSFFVKFLAIIGGLTIFGFIAVIIGFISLLFLPDTGNVSDNTVLELNLEQTFIEYIPDDPFTDAILEGTMEVKDVVDVLEQAKHDDRVVALLAKAGTGLIGLAHIQEIRDAILSFRESGKPAVVFSETFGGPGPGNGSYYLATAFDEIYLAPSGDVGLTGFISETPFIKGMFDKLGIVPRGDRRYEYKNAFNMFTETEYTEHHREAAQSLLDSRYDQFIRGIAEQRGLTERAVRSLVDQGPFLGHDAEQAGLVDRLAYRDEVFDSVEEQFGEDVSYLSASKYLSITGRPNSEGTGVALIYGVGGIQRGPSDFDPFAMTSTMGSSTVTRAFRSATEDEDVKAVLFRVDSPGGGYIASDLIWREILETREAGKPVIISMGNVAASGGYFVSIPADKIIAQPATITGSIGVLSLKLIMRDFFGKLGITWDEVHAGENATAWSSLHDYTPEQWERYQDWLDNIYTDFTTKVAEGRDLNIERVTEIAKGRVWTGEDALALGLVDELGGYPAALRSVREALDLEENAPLNIRQFPKPKTFIESIQSFISMASVGTETTGSIVNTLRSLRPALKILQQITGKSEDTVLITPNYDILKMSQ